MQLSIVIVSWNVRELASRLLDSIFQFTEELEYEVIVIDNDSKDNTIKFLKENYSAWIESKKLILIDNDFNAGFSKANNQGLKIAKGKYILFMNPDMELLENSFKKLFDFMEQTPNAGICACRLLYGDKTIQPNVKNDPTLASQILILLKLHHFLSWLPCLKKYLRKDFNYSQKQYVKQVMGAFIFTKKELMSEINGWDEDYWLWWEDLELCRSVREHGSEIVYLPITEVIHYEGKSFAQTYGLNKQKRFNKGLLTYFRKHHSKFACALLSLLQPVSLTLALLAQIVKIRPRTQSKL